jgi:biotin carboxyl carrier protein
MMEIDDLKELISLLQDTDITEIQLEKEGTKVKIRRQMLVSSLEMRSKNAPVTIEKTMEAEEEVQRLITVTSPIVGTFYRSQSPEAPPFVEAGARVEIESEVEGVIVRALVENGQPVEYGEPLFLIEPVG